jgi:hypothetical protein
MMERHLVEDDLPALPYRGALFRERAAAFGVIFGGLTFRQHFG